MYLLDTNILSLLDPRRRDRCPELIDWIEQSGDALYLSAMTLAEMEAGILKLKREQKPGRALELQTLRDRIVTDFGDRVLPMDGLTALQVARLAEAARPAVIELADLIIAATAHRHGLTLLTANLKHFRALGISMLNPLEGLPEAEA